MVYTCLYDPCMVILGMGYCLNHIVVSIFHIVVSINGAHLYFMGFSLTKTICFGDPHDYMETPTNYNVFTTAKRQREP